MTIVKGPAAGIAAAVAVWWLVHWRVVNVQFQAVTGTNCTGVRVAITNAGVAGAFHYKHITPLAGVIGSTTQNYTNFGSSVQKDRFLGAVAPSQAGSCPYTPSHLHQSGDVAWYTNIWRAIPSDSNCDATRCPWAGEMFQVVW